MPSSTRGRQVPKPLNVVFNSCSYLCLFGHFEGDWTFIVNGRKRSYVFHAKLQEEAIRWVNAIQEVGIFFI